MKLTRVSPGVYKDSDSGVTYKETSNGIINSKTGVPLSGNGLATFNNAKTAAQQTAASAGNTSTPGGISQSNPKYKFPTGTSNPTVQPATNHNYTSVAGQLQGQADENTATAKQNAITNNADVSGPFGTSVTTVDANGQPITQNTLSQGNQNIVNNQQTLGTSALQAGQNLLGSLNTGSGTANSVNPYTQAYYNQETSLLNPQFQQAQAQEGQDVANRGLPVGGEAYNNAWNNLNNNWASQYNNAASQAVTAGNQQALNTLGTLNTIGAGAYYNPNFQQTNGTALNPLNVASTSQGQEGVNLASQGLAGSLALNYGGNFNSTPQTASS